MTELLAPADGVPPIITDRDRLTALAEDLAAGSGPVAVDAERASGFRYSARAYLVQLRREGAGSALVDPIALDGDLSVLGDALRGVEWVLHAASQDLPCLAEVGMRPDALFDTELAGRLAGYPRVGLGPLAERLLGVHLRKGYGAADWSTRPLPDDWLVYAALDVELLVAMRDLLAADLDRQGKAEWARQEFEAVRLAGPPARRAEPWRRTSGMHKVRRPRQLAVVRALWESRDELAESRDVAPGRLLPDAAIVDAALREPDSREALTEMPVFRGSRQRRLADRWWRAVRTGRGLPAEDLPATSPAGDGPPPVNRWADKDPDAAARLTAARAHLATLSEQWDTPVENLLQPDLVRRLCWTPPDPADASAVDEVLTTGGARPWQRELALPGLVAALAETAPPEAADRSGDPDTTPAPAGGDGPRRAPRRRRRRGGSAERAQVGTVTPVFSDPET
ncbi:ribonuclease D [Actinomycetospora termitidis]|uniref:Ribonuclease D n=1 Tax=Actinomycetospora termitidis TaxID=3053470 RepID=A0ABT7MAV6_9PSEU|nr:ribonuclease D [Actinomycetospora sp. Odt1-22]MDL5156553.1 ribonuclease D [Actinomycetospora sp. Odt1-22]